MADRVSVLEERLDDVARVVGQLEARLTRLENQLRETDGREPLPGGAARIQDVDRAAGGQFASASPDASPPRSEAVALLTLIGRTVLALGGGYLLRALTDSGSLDPTSGAIAGIVYAALWVVLAEAAARSRAPVSANFHGLAATLIVSPLVVEATVTLETLSPYLGTLALGGVAGGLLWVAGRHRVRGLAWTATVIPMLTGVVLVVLGGEVRAPALLLGVLGVWSLWLALVREWWLLPWLPGLVADAVVLSLGVGVVLGAVWPGPGQALVVQLSLAAGYLGTIAASTLVLGRVVSAFEILQAVVVLVLGVAGAVFIAGQGSPVATAVGLWAVITGALAYRLMFRDVFEPLKSRRNFHFFAATAVVLTIGGTGLLTPQWGLELLWAGFAVLGLGAARVVARDGDTLLMHGVCYLAAAATASGWVSSAGDVLLARPPALGLPVGFVPFAVLVAILAAPVVASGGNGESTPMRGLSRTLTWALGTWVALGLVAAGGLALAFDVRANDVGVVAAIRTAALTGAVIALALTAWRAGYIEAGPLVSPLLGLMAVKLVFEDFLVGRPMTLFLALALYGGALIAAARLKPQRPT